MTAPAMTRVVVVGGGIAGLAAALGVRKARPDVEVIVLEQADRVGGKLRSAELAGHRIDVGAEAMLARRPEGLDLLALLGASDERVSPLTTAAGLWIDGHIRPLPGGTVLGVPGDVEAGVGVLSEATLHRMRAEADRDEPPITQDVSVGALVASRMGQEVVDRIVDPLLGGVYAGRAEQISLRAAIPALAAELHTRGGSLLEAARSVAARGRAANVDGPVFASIHGGLGRLPELIVGRGDFSVRTSTAVREIRIGTDGFVLLVGSVPTGEQLIADAVIVATPPAKAARLLQSIAPAAASELVGIETASVVIASLAFPAATPLPAGSGLLVPATSGRSVKGVTISSQKWPGAPAELALVRASIGRIGDEAVLQRDDAELIALARRELTELIGVTAAPVDAILTRWGGGLPQYEVGHLERVGRIRESVAGVPGLAVAGASYDGVGIPATIHSAQLAAGRVLAFLAGRGQ
ncbi:MAG: Protoporphyrinogen oxidase [Pseudonocardiales bacterium]|nr:Protoporphyrinogen oxidase [Pseudonocardiales bacterium]